MKARNRACRNWFAVLPPVCLAALWLCASGADARGETIRHPYQDESLPFSVRAADLVSRMTQEEKAAQFASTLYNQSQGQAAPAIPRLQLRTYNYWSEALHGVAREGAATEFTTGLGIASTWDRALVRAVTDAIADEARVKTNDCYKLDASGRPTAAVTEQCKGLTYWSPTINLAREPRWGRAEEGYGEDPFLAGEIAGQFTLGLQGGDASKPDSVGLHLKAVATPKHYIANSSEVNRHTGTSNLSDRSLHEYYAAHFGRVMRKYGAKSYMTSYNAINVDDDYTGLHAPPVIRNGKEAQFRGVETTTDPAVTTPVPASNYANNTLMRRMYGFDGFVTSDCGATNNVYGTGPGFGGGHNWAPAEIGRQVTPAEGAAYALKAGTDVDCWASVYPKFLPEAQDLGLVTEQDMDVALTRAITVRMQLGEFDVANPYRTAEYTTAAASAKSINSAAHQALAHQMALEAPVLLKNDGALPLADTAGKTLVYGYYGSQAVHGDYSPTSTARPTISAAEGLARRLGADKVAAVPDADLTFYGNPAPAAPGAPRGFGAMFSPVGLYYHDAAGEQAGLLPLDKANEGNWAADGDGFVISRQDMNFWQEGLVLVNLRAGDRLGGWFSVKASKIPDGADQVVLHLQGTPLPRDASAQYARDCATPNDATGCKTIGVFTVSAGGKAVTKDVHVRYVQDESTGSSVQARYAPVAVKLSEFGLKAGDSAEFRYDFGVTGIRSGSASGLNISTCAAPDCSAANDASSDEGRIAQAANIVVYLGTNENDSAEEQDRPSVDFPHMQAEMAARIIELAHKHGKKAVVWVQAVGQMNLAPFKDAADAIVWSTYNGEFQGEAVAELLFGADVKLEDGRGMPANPSGKLVFTYYSDVAKQLTQSTDYALTTAEYKATTDPAGSVCGRTYWYYSVGAKKECAPPDYPFGHGLSYTDFAYENLRLSKKSATPKDTVTATVTVRNTGRRAGREIVQLYASAPKADGKNRPWKQLKGFAKTGVLQPGASEDVAIELPVEELWFWSDKQARVYDEGAWTIQVAPSSADKAGLAAKLSVSGAREARHGVDVVAAIPDGVALNLKTPDNVIHPQLSATRHDQSFWDLDAAGSALSVEYSSANPQVATVGKDGAVHAAGVGATLVTATVTAGGESKSTSFPVVVHDGVPTEGAVMTDANGVKYGATATKYNFLVNFGDPKPRLAQAKKGVQLAAGVYPAAPGASYKYLIAPMDLNEIGATVTEGGVLTAQKPGRVRVTVVATVGGVPVSRSALVHVLADR
ncbi:MAG: glycoside hydrolase family 3 C-terminal domain-containing protein [Acidobacteriota bacterium]|nr:glycoside hydrolase family 3 C-terminal domain-containing protein [Acidobacteriota bacterium]